MVPMCCVLGVIGAFGAEAFSIMQGLYSRNIVDILVKRFATSLHMSISDHIPVAINGQ